MESVVKCAKKYGRDIYTLMVPGASTGFHGSLHVRKTVVRVVLSIRMVSPKVFGVTRISFLIIPCTKGRKQGKTGTQGRGLQ